MTDIKRNEFHREAERLIAQETKWYSEAAIPLAILAVAEEIRLIRVEVQKAGGEIDTLLNKIPDIGNMLEGF